MSDHDEVPDGLSPAETKQVAKIRRGDGEAFKDLFHTNEPLVYGVCLSIVDIPEVAQDLTQGLFCDLWDRRESLSPKLSLKAYLAGAARNKALMHLRRQRDRESFDKWDATAQETGRPEGIRGLRNRVTPRDALQHRDLRQALQRAIQELPKRRRLIYRMARQEHMSYAGIAAALDISVNTVKTQMGRAFKFLRQRLKIYGFASQAN